MYKLIRVQVARPFVTRHHFLKAMVNSLVPIRSCSNIKQNRFKEEHVKTLDIKQIFNSDNQLKPEDKCEHLLARTIRMAEWELIAISEQENLINRNLSADDLAWRGLAINNLKFDKTYFKHIESRGDIEFKLRLCDNDESITGMRSFRTGVLVNIALKDPTTDEKNFGEKRSRSTTWKIVSGIISHVSDTYLTVRSSSLSEGFILEGFSKKKQDTFVHVIRRSDADIGRKNIQSLKQVRKDPVNFSILNFLVGNVSATSKMMTTVVQPQKVHIFRKDFDKSKIDAIHLTAERHPLTIIHGPPGTGKTTTLAAAILSAVANGDRVVAVAPSHAAVDALTQAILAQWPSDLGDPRQRLVRLGNELRVTVPSVLPYLPLNKTKPSREKQILSSELFKARQDLLNYTVKEGKGDLMKKELQLRQDLLEYCNKEEGDSINESDVIICTNVVAHSNRFIRKAIEKEDINLVCLDEAGFATDSGTLPLLLRSSRIILSGDHCQLPPVVLSERAKADGYHISLMERLAKRFPERVALLSTQYRSNHLISGWSSKYFYGNALKADQSVARSTLSDLRGVVPCNDTRISLLFVDTKNRGFKDNSHGTANNDISEESCANFDEAFVVEHLVRKYISLGVKPQHIGVISPYWAQVALLRSLLWDGPQDLQRVAIHTVDGFQGREKELIFISFVRSNDAKQVGFLSETRRINVSVTRAKRSCIAIGDSSTLESDKGLKSFIEYCKTNNAVMDVEKIKL